MYNYICTFYVHIKSDFSKTGTSCKGILPYRLHSLWNMNEKETFTLFKGILFYFEFRKRIRNQNMFDVCACKSTIFYFCKMRGNSNGTGKTVTFKKRLDIL